MSQAVCEIHQKMRETPTERDNRTKQRYEKKEIKRKRQKKTKHPVKK